MAENLPSKVLDVNLNGGIRVNADGVVPRSQEAKRSTVCLTLLLVRAGAWKRIYLFGCELGHRIAVEENANLIGREL
jgi:hypothetical protein